MSDYFVCCENCFGNVARVNTRAARTWMTLCKISTEHNAYIAIKNLDTEEFRILEMLGYITTTDIPEHTLIRVNGRYQTEEKEEIYCIQNCKH